MKDTIKISVREIVEYILQSGDINSGFVGMSAAADGTRIHKMIQQMRPEGYMAEIPVSIALENGETTLFIEGRIDGLFDDGKYMVIEEIKTTSQDFSCINEDYNLLHWAQAKLYAYMYSIQNDIDWMKIQLTYCQRETLEIMSFVKIFSINELTEFFNDVAGKYFKWMLRIKSWENTRNKSVKELKFPFESYRKGQREFAVMVYKTISGSGKLYAKAPTGIGKTVAAVFPAVKAMGEGLSDKIFYLTAKTIAAGVAENAFNRLRDNGLKFKVLTLTAKEKICLNDECKCVPEFCPFARGYFDRIRDAVEDIYELDSYNQDVIKEYSLKHMVCPFEFSLELSLWSDCIICDYNYAFDPLVYLKRFFMNNEGRYTFLIDEAHNLVDRARDMFSAEFMKKPVLELKREVKKEIPELYKILNDINSYMISLRKKCDDQMVPFIVTKEQDKEMYSLLRKFVNTADIYLSKNRPYSFREELLDLYFQASAFLKISEYYDQRYVTYYQKERNDIKLKLFCLDPSHILKNITERSRAAVFFSATLTPLDYYTRMLGGDTNDMKISIPSPFPQENLCVIAADNVGTRYVQRETTYDYITELIYSAVRGKVGNYIVYFPSYKYLNEVYARFASLDFGIRTICQYPEMNEKDKQGFLECFSDDVKETLVGFAVMGGMFGEGIDLTGDRLSGVVIVGVGLPMLCLERDIIKEYFEECNGMGFEYSYMYPGFNKVLQAAGRVIRTERDRGFVVLVDDRFGSIRYKELFPDYWSLTNARSKTKVEDVVKEFWESENDEN